MIAYNNSYLNSRLLNEDEEVLFSGLVRIKNRTQTKKGHMLMKDRFAVLCPSRILLFKSESEKAAGKGCNAVYPLIRSDFNLHEATNLTETTFANSCDEAASSSN